MFFILFLEARHTFDTNFLYDVLVIRKDDRNASVSEN